jgi:hypothetical protein
MHRMESWIKEEAPGKALATLQGVLNFDFSRRADTLEAVDRFEMLCDEHESATSLILEDSIKLAVLLRALPAELKTNVYSSPTAVDDICHSKEYGDYFVRSH